MKEMTAMMEKLEGSKQTGRFTVSPGKEIYGELTLAGQKTSLYLQDGEYFDTRSLPSGCVTGVLNDLTKVSLIHCITPATGSAGGGGGHYHFANVFPHYVIYGDHHIGPDEKMITEVHFAVDDATTLFYDFDAFGSVLDPRPFIDQIAHANALGRQIKTGPDPQILYFTGKREIFAADTVLGKVDASHSPIPDLPGPDGVRLKNRIFVTVAFNEGVVFEDAISRALTLLRYLGMLAGRPQNLLSLGLRIGAGIDVPAFLQVYWSIPPERDASREWENKPHPSDVLLDAVSDPERFSNVLASWLDRQEEWHDARLRFYNSFAQQRHYDIDRLIGSANMFDILPSSAVPPVVKLTDEVNAAKEASRKIFENLPQSPERDRILGELGRIGTSSLKHKIRHRAKFIIARTGNRFSQLPLVTDEAVNCRNHYVHGSDPRFDYNQNFDIVGFFIDTLEFVFAASDLMEAGWNVKAWSEAHTMMSHPFAAFRVNYPMRLQRLKALLPGSASVLSGPSGSP